MILAKCTNCSHVFRSAIQVAGSGVVFASGNHEQCPKCGGLATTAEGTFAVTDSKAVPEAGPRWTFDMYQRFEELAEKAKVEELSAADILREVGDISPELAKDLSKRGLSSTILILVLLLLVKTCNVNATIDVNRLIDQVMHTEGATTAPASAPISKKEKPA